MDDWEGNDMRKKTLIRLACLLLMLSAMAPARLRGHGAQAVSKCYNRGTGGAGLLGHPAVCPFLHRPTQLSVAGK